MADYDLAIMLDPRHAIALSARAELWAEHGDYARAANDLSASVRLQEQIDGLDFYEGSLLQRIDQSGSDVLPVAHQVAQQNQSIFEINTKQ